VLPLHSSFILRRFGRLFHSFDYFSSEFSRSLSQRCFSHFPSFVSTPLVTGWSESTTELFGTLNQTTLHKGLLKGPAFQSHSSTLHRIDYPVFRPSRIQYNKHKSNKNSPSTEGYVPFSICSTFLVPFLSSWPILFDHPFSLSTLSWYASWGCDGAKNVFGPPSLQGTFHFQR
jgi:hypothetical protein